MPPADLVTIAGQCGHEARHVARVGRAGWKDWNVTRYARDNDLILVTNNATDFRQRYAAEALHAGLVILIPAVNRMMQQRLFKAALDELADIGEPVNRVLEVDLDRRRGDLRALRFAVNSDPTMVISPLPGTPT